jgi:hypothetical protein
MQFGSISVPLHGSAMHLLVPVTDRDAPSFPLHELSLLLGESSFTRDTIVSHVPRVADPKGGR